MNGPTKPFAHPANEREWQVQERAAQAERTHANAGADDARTREYRLLARMLGEAPVESLPVDFAASVAQRVRAESRATPSDAELFASPFERHLLQVLVAAFGIALGAVIASLSGDTLQSIGAGALAVGAYATNPWVLALATCLALSAGMQLWHPRGR